MSVIGALDTNTFFNNQPYIEGLKLNVENTAKQEVIQQKEIAARQEAVMNASTASATSKATLYMALGAIAVVGLLTFIVLKKKGIIK